MNILPARRPIDIDGYQVVLCPSTKSRTFNVWSVECQEFIGKIENIRGTTFFEGLALINPTKEHPDTLGITHFCPVSDKGHESHVAIQLIISEHRKLRPDLSQVA
jgi:hypothetical protein